MADLEWPAEFVPNVQMDFHLEITGVHVVSPLSGAMQSLQRGGHFWTAELEFSPLPNDTGAAGRLQAFLAKLGVLNRVTLHDHSKPEARGQLGGAPAVAAAAALGSTTVPLDGCTPNVQGWLLSGDMMMVSDGASPERTQLVICTADAATDGAGETEVEFQPPLRFPLSEGAAVKFGSEARARFYLATSPMRSTRPGRFSALTIALREDVSI